MNEPLFQFPSQVPPIEAVDEFKLQNALYSAEFGMGVGQVSVAMRSGTNGLHGSLWDFLRNDALQKFQPRFHNKTPLKQNQFGFTTGGPAFLPSFTTAATVRSSLSAITEAGVPPAVMAW